MKNPEKTDMTKIKELAMTYLCYPIYIYNTQYGLVSHPFTNSDALFYEGEFYRFADDLRGTEEYKGNEMLIGKGRTYDLFKKILTQRINESKDITTIMLMVTKAYKLEFVYKARKFLSIEDFSKALFDSWVDAEFTNTSSGLSLTQLRSLFTAIKPEYAMSEEEYSIYQSLPNEVVIYRGVGQRNKNRIKVLSWTLNKNMAEWFAKRYLGTLSKNGWVYKAKIEKEHIFAYSARDSEVIVDYKFLDNIELLEKFEA